MYINLVNHVRSIKFTNMSACIQCLNHELGFRGDAYLPIRPSTEFYLSPDGGNLESLEMQIVRESCTLSESQFHLYPPVQGRLRQHSECWLKELEPSSFVQTIITQGYRLTFTRLSDPICIYNHKSALAMAHLKS